MYQANGLYQWLSKLLRRVALTRLHERHLSWMRLTLFNWFISDESMKHTVHNIIILFKTYPFYNYVTFATYQIEPNGEYHSVLLIERSKAFYFALVWHLDLKWKIWYLLFKFNHSAYYNRLKRWFLIKCFVVFARLIYSRKLKKEWQDKVAKKLLM